MRRATLRKTRPVATAIVGEISVVDGELQRVSAWPTKRRYRASLVSLIEQRDLVQAYREGKVEVHPAHRRMMSNLILAHPQREQFRPRCAR